MYDNHQYFTQASNTKYKLLLNSYLMILYRGTLVKLSVWYMQHLFDIYDCFLEISIAFMEKSSRVEQVRVSLVVISCWLYLDVVSFTMKFYYNTIYLHSLDLIDLSPVFNFSFGLKYNYDFFVYTAPSLLSELIFLLDIKLCNYFVKITKLTSPSGKLYL